MSRYLNSQELTDLNALRKQIFALRSEAFQKYKIDVLDNDTLSSLSIYEVINHYDKHYNINFARNGEDAISNGLIVEQKCSRVKARVRAGGYAEAQFQFHAMGELDYPRYVLATRDEADLKVLQIYDISQPANTEILQQHLHDQRRTWLDRGRAEERKMKRDVITIPESLLKTLPGLKLTVIDGVTVYKD